MCVLFQQCYCRLYKISGRISYPFTKRVVVSFAVVAVDAKEVAFFHFGVENGFDLVQSRCIGFVVHKTTNATVFTCECVFAFQFGTLVPVVEVESEHILWRDGAFAL